MITSSQKVIEEFSAIQKKLIEFLKTHSILVRKVFPSDFIFMGGDYGFQPLQAPGIVIQDQLYKKLNQQAEVVRILLSASVNNHQERLNAALEVIREYIVQKNYTYKSSLKEIIEDSNRRFDEIMATIRQLYPDTYSRPVLIPDTNALYANDDIEKWTFEAFKQFTIILTPSVLKDLDKHKIEHRNEEVRRKALKLINKIKEYRRRGKLTEGVDIVSNTIHLITIATEANFKNSLSWLDPTNEDDRLIAECFDIVRQYADRPVLLITGDINLQNKCEVADLIFEEPPSKA